MRGAGFDLLMVCASPSTPTPARFDGEPPVPPRQIGKIAIKVINHYGDEVLQVYDV